MENKANTDKIRNAKNALQTETSKLEASVNNISRKMDKIEKDASDFSRKMDDFDPSKVEDAIKEHASQLSNIVDRISSGSDNLSNLNRNVERKLNKVLGEIESINQLLQKQRKSLAEAQETSSKNKSNSNEQIGDLGNGVAIFISFNMGNRNSNKFIVGAFSVGYLPMVSEPAKSRYCNRVLCC